MMAAGENDLNHVRNNWKKAKDNVQSAMICYRQKKQKVIMFFEHYQVLMITSYFTLLKSKCSSGSADHILSSFYAGFSFIPSQKIHGRELF